MNEVKQRSTIVLIEDDQDACEILASILIKNGYDVIQLFDGSTVFESELNADLYIIDNGLPIVDGIALCKFLRVNPDTSSTPAIMISANGSIRERAVDAGATSFLEKPFYVKELLSTVAASLLKEPVNQKVC
jgi:DNA-binding response OmpR family regulator